MNSAAERSASNEKEGVFSLRQPAMTVTRLQHQVKHGLFKWSIENFSSFPAADDRYCLSSVSELGETWWYLALHPKAKICGQDKISLNLIRHKSDPGPQKVIVSYRLGLESGENKVWFKPEESVVFGKGDSYGVQTSILGHLEDFLTEGVEDTLSVLCEMYAVYALNVTATSCSQNRPIDRELPLNLVCLFKKQKRCDVLIEIPKLSVKAHKCVLFARSKTFARMLEDGKSFIQLLCTRSCLYCVLYYIYSGSLIFLAKKAVFSIGLYELACELSLLKLRDFLTPYKIELKSRIAVDECKIACALHNICLSDILTEKMESRVSFDRGTGIGIKICFQHMNNCDYLQFRIKVSGIVGALDFCFQLYILNKFCEPFEMIPMTFFQNPNVEYKNLIFTYTVCLSMMDILSDFLSDGNIYLNFACKRYSLIHLWDISSLNGGKELTVSSNNFNTWLEDLSSDMKSLLSSHYLSDITLIASRYTVKVHRSILEARSGYFHELFVDDYQKNKVLLISDIRPSILSLILLYIYSGAVSVPSGFRKHDILNLYNAAEQFKVNSLRMQCAKFLVLKLDNSFVFDVLSSAKHYENSYLIRECKNYVNRHQLRNVVVDEDSSDRDSSDEYSPDKDESDEDSSDEDSSDEDSSEKGSPEDDIVQKPSFKKTL